MLDFLLEKIGPGKKGSFFESIPHEFKSYWFLSPRQHMVELVFYLSLFIPLLRWTWSDMDRMIKNSSLKWTYNRTGKLEYLFGTVCLLTFIAVTYYKIDLSAPFKLVYIFQPCHMITLCYFLALMILSRKYSNFVFNLSASLSWSATLALIFPDFEGYRFFGEYVVFYVEHGLMLIIPAVYYMSGRFHAFVSLRWILLTHMLFSLYHCVILEGIAIISEVNIATLMAPPTPLKVVGVWYRPIMYLLCGAMTFLHHLLNYTFVALGNMRLRK